MIFFIFRLPIFIILVLFRIITFPLRLIKYISNFALTVVVIIGLIIGISMFQGVEYEEFSQEVISVFEGVLAEEKIEDIESFEEEYGEEFEEVYSSWSGSLEEFVEKYSEEIQEGDIEKIEEDLE